MVDLMNYFDVVDLVHFSMNLVKEVKLTAKLKSPKFGNGGCIYYHAAYSLGIGSQE